MSTYLPHPLKRYTGFDPGRPDHVAALVVAKHGGKFAIFYGEDCVLRPTTKRACEQYLARAAANAVECQEERARERTVRLALTLEYLAKRKARTGGQQLTLF